jgi:hypothetical protein
LPTFPDDTGRFGGRETYKSRYGDARKQEAGEADDELPPVSVRHEIESGDGDSHSEQETPGEQEARPFQWGTHLNGPPEPAKEKYAKQGTSE